MEITFQFWNDSSYQSYDLQSQQVLYQSLSQSPRPTQVLLPPHYVISNFEKVELGGSVQKNAKTGFTRWIRIRPPYVLPGAPPALAVPRDLYFCFEDGRDASQLVPFSEELQADLKSFLGSSPRPTEVFFQAKGSPYLLLGLDQMQDFKSQAQLTQVNLKTGFNRGVRLLQGPMPRVPPPRPSFYGGGGASSSHSPYLGAGWAGMPASASGQGSRRRMDPPTPARSSSFSLSSAVFSVSSEGRREKMGEKAASLLLRQWTSSVRPSQANLEEEGIVENLQGLEQGKAVLRKSSGSQRYRIAVKLPQPMPGTLSLPADLEQGEALDILSTGKALNDKEIAELPSDERQCPICMDDMEPSQPQIQLDEDGDVEMIECVNPSLSCAPAAPPAQGSFRLHCGHAYHMSCLRTWFAQKSRCPSCQQEFGKVVGKQPRLGTFSWHLEDFTLPGHPDAAKTIVVQFGFPDGTDDEGKTYSGRKPKGYLPCNAQGILLLELFKVAFRRRVMFGMGESMTFKSYRPTFNIHIKTASSGGQTKHGYPDETYFQRSLAELKANGVSLSDLRR